MATYTSVPTADRNKVQAASGGTLDPEAGVEPALQGAALGGTIGTAILPGVGTVAGALVGGAIGFFAGAAGGATKKTDALMAENAAKQAEAKAAMMTDVDAKANTKATAASPTLGIGGAPLTSGGTAAKYTTGAGALPYDSWNARVYGG